MARTSIATERTVRVSLPFAVELKGLVPVNGIALKPGDRVLARAQPTLAACGVYLVREQEWERVGDPVKVHDLWYAKEEGPFGSVWYCSQTSCPPWFQELYSGD